MNGIIILKVKKTNVASLIAAGVAIGLAGLVAVIWLYSFDGSTSAGVTLKAPPKIDAANLGLPTPERKEYPPIPSPPAVRQRNAVSLAGAGVGSEGYAPKILHALGVGTPADALAAANLIVVCREADRSIEILHRLKAENTIKKIDIGYVRAIEISQAEQRACQTVTPDLLAARPQLLFKAIEGKQFGAAATYVSEVQATTGIEPARQALVGAALRADAEQGDKQAVAWLAFRAAEFGVSEVDRRAYLLANKVIFGKGSSWPKSYFSELFEDHFESQPSLSDAQRAQAERKSQALVEAYERRKLTNP